MGCWPYFDPLMSKKTTRSHTKFVDIYKVKTFSSKLVVSVLNLKKKKKIVADHPMNTRTKFDSNRPSGFGEVSQ